ncbi:MAG TPA: hypothetical protein VI279_13355 [Rhodocyclaceae bacterium]
MERLKLGLIARGEWELRRLARAIWRTGGWPAVVFIVVATLLLVGIVSARQMSARLYGLEERISRLSTGANSERIAHVNSVAEDLGAFQAYLPQHDDIPDILKRLLLLAEDQGLVFASGEYKAEADNGFTAYRMTLPVKGDAAAIQSFLLAALKEHRTLALESAAFRRQRIDAKDVEARLNLLLLVRLPAERPVTATQAESFR